MAQPLDLSGAEPVTKAPPSLDLSGAKTLTTPPSAPQPLDLTGAKPVLPKSTTSPRSPDSSVHLKDLVPSGDTLSKIGEGTGDAGLASGAMGAAVSLATGQPELAPLSGATGFVLGAGYQALTNTIRLAMDHFGAPDKWKHQADGIAAALMVGKNPFSVAGLASRAAAFTGVKVIDVAQEKVHEFNKWMQEKAQKHPDNKLLNDLSLMAGEADKHFTWLLGGAVVGGAHMMHRATKNYINGIKPPPSRTLVPQALKETEDLSPPKSSTSEPPQPAKAALPERKATVTKTPEGKYLVHKQEGGLVKSTTLHNSWETAQGAASDWEKPGWMNGPKALPPAPTIKLYEEINAKPSPVYPNAPTVQDRISRTVKDIMGRRWFSDPARPLDLSSDEFKVRPIQNTFALLGQHYNDVMETLGKTAQERQQTMREAIYWWEAQKGVTPKEYRGHWPSDMHMTPGVKRAVDAIQEFQPVFKALGAQLSARGFEVGNVIKTGRYFPRIEDIGGYEGEDLFSSNATAGRFHRSLYESEGQSPSPTKNRYFLTLAAMPQVAARMARNIGQYDQMMNLIKSGQITIVGPELHYPKEYLEKGHMGGVPKESVNLKVALMNEGYRPLGEVIGKRGGLAPNVAQALTKHGDLNQIWVKQGSEEEVRHWIGGAPDMGWMRLIAGANRQYVRINLTTQPWIHGLLITSKSVPYLGVNFKGYMSAYKDHDLVNLALSNGLNPTVSREQIDAAISEAGDKLETQLAGSGEWSKKLPASAMKIISPFQKFAEDSHKLLWQDWSTRLSYGVFKKEYEKGVKKGLSRTEAARSAAEVANKVIGVMGRQHQNHLQSLLASSTFFAKGFTLSNLAMFNAAAGRVLQYATLGRLGKNMGIASHLINESPRVKAFVQSELAKGFYVDAMLSILMNSSMQYALTQTLPIDNPKGKKFRVDLGPAGSDFPEDVFYLSNLFRNSSLYLDIVEHAYDGDLRGMSDSLKSRLGFLPSLVLNANELVQGDTNYLGEMLMPNLIRNLQKEVQAQTPMTQLGGALQEFPGGYAQPSLPPERSKAIQSHVQQGHDIDTMRTHIRQWIATGASVDWVMSKAFEEYGQTIKPKVIAQTVHSYFRNVKPPTKLIPKEAK